MRNRLCCHEIFWNLKLSNSLTTEAWLHFDHITHIQAQTTHRVCNKNHFQKFSKLVPKELYLNILIKEEIFSKNKNGSKFIITSTLRIRNKCISQKIILCTSHQKAPLKETVSAVESPLEPLLKLPQIKFFLRLSKYLHWPKLQYQKFWKKNRVTLKKLKSNLDWKFLLSFWTSPTT